jgi:hypothetical protein
VDADTIYVSGRYGGTNALLGGQGLLARFDKETGDHLSHTTWGGPMDESIQGLVISGDRAYLAGITKSYGKGQDDAILIKADASTDEFPDKGSRE